MQHRPHRASAIALVDIFAQMHVVIGGRDVVRAGAGLRPQAAKSVAIPLRRGGKQRAREFFGSRGLPGVRFEQSARYLELGVGLKAHEMQSVGVAAKLSAIARDIAAA